MKVLSLFDGISCGQLALQRANINVTEYYSSEIDKHAIKVTQANFPDTLQVGDVTEIHNVPFTVDLLLGGSPCQSFSSAGTQTGFDGASGLFYEYVRILNLVTPRYFLLENVKMKKEWKDIISEELGVEPILINSSLVSAQNRERYYWTNIPNVGQPLDLDINFRDISEDDYKFTAAMRGRRINPEQVSRSDYDLSIPIKQYIEYRSDNKTNCLTTVSKDNVLVKYQGHSRSLASEVDYRYLTVNEMELLQTLPIDYTNSISNSQRVKAIGNSWTVDVIAHILRNIE